jgi:release factor glutamine methyltransferase
MTVREALREGAAALAGTETPFLDASLLLGSALHLDSCQLAASGPEPVGEGALEAYRARIASRARGLPVAYILGYKEFWGRRFAVDPRALIPRPDTETLVEAALRIGDALARSSPAVLRLGDTLRSGTISADEGEDTEAAEGQGKGPVPSDGPASLSRLRAHETCTGSGCVAISVAADRPDWEVSASDLSEDALELARANAEAILRAGSRPGGALAFSRGDLLDSAGGPFDLIIANPPYVSSRETDSLLALGWSEPRLALDGGPDGLDLVRRLVPQAAGALAPGGALLVEADGSQAEAVAGLFREAGLYDIQTLCDLGGRPRVTSGRRPWTT